MGRRQGIDLSPPTVWEIEQGEEVLFLAPGAAWNSDIPATLGNMNLFLIPFGLD
jgi:hypothetical protein